MNCEKNGWTSQVAVWDAESVGSKEPRIRWGYRSPVGRAILREKEMGAR